MAVNRSRLVVSSWSIAALAGAVLAVVATSTADAAPPLALPATSGGGITLKHCLITAIDDVQVASQRAGLITQLHVKEGVHVEQGASAAQIDDSEAKLQVQETKANYIVAKSRADSAYETEYAVATHRTALQEHKIATSVNEKHGGAVSALEVERLRLAAEQAFIKIDVAKLERKIKGDESAGIEAKAQLAETVLKQHNIRAPIEGEVVEIYLRAGEWVEAGKPVLRIVRLDRLRVEGFVKVQEISPIEIYNKPVRIEVELARGKRQVFEGEVTYVNPLVQPGGEYRVWAEVNNRREEGQWLLGPGLEAEMTIGK